MYYYILSFSLDAPEILVDFMCTSSYPGNLLLTF